MKIGPVWSARIGTAVLRLLGMTWRVQRQNDAPWRALKAQGKPFVFAIWHGELLPLIWTHRGLGIVVLVSEHRDGEIIARVLHSLGIETTRGSSTRGGIRALLGLIRALESGKIGAVTPDGPRGPRHSYQPGVLAGAKKANAPVVAIGIAVSRAWRLKSWDQFAIPKPFARITLSYSDPLFVDASVGDVAQEVPRFTAQLHDAGARAAEALARG